jgi:Tol biopolymer transport system component
VQNRELVWLDSSGKEVDHWGEPAPYTGGTYSPRSQSAILYRANPNGRGNSLWLADAERKTVIRLTADSELDQTGVVSADGNNVLIGATSGYASSLVQRWLMASGKEEKLFEEPRGFFHIASVSRDGRYVFFSQQNANTNYDIYYMDLTGDRKLVPLLNSPYAELDARLSPDDKWLAYTTDETGSLELYVTPFPGGVPSGRSPTTVFIPGKPMALWIGPLTERACDISKETCSTRWNSATTGASRSFRRPRDS